MTLRLLPLLAVLAILAAGCSGEPYQTASVSGRVTLNGQPVAGVAVMFQPVAPDGNVNPGPGSTGVTDSEGRYSLKVIGKDIRGAVIGMHKVRLTPFEQPGDPSDDRPKRAKPTLRIPARYNKLEGTPFEVPAGGTDKADFPLTSP
jgi:hypothetical protein